VISRAMSKPRETSRGSKNASGVSSKRRLAESRSWSPAPDERAPVRALQDRGRADQAADWPSGLPR
jgi:hypothetical protein